jgi:hypothetical protein
VSKNLCNAFLQVYWRDSRSEEFKGEFEETGPGEGISSERRGKGSCSRRRGRRRGGSVVKEDRRRVVVGEQEAIYTSK